MNQRFQVTSRGEKTRVMYFDTIKELDIARTTQVEELEREEFTVYVNLLQKLSYQFNLEEKCFYLDVEDSEANTKQLDKMSELCEGLDEKNPEDKAKIQEIMKEHYIQFIVREKIVIKYGDNKCLAELVTDFITDNNI